MRFLRIVVPLLAVLGGLVTPVVAESNREIRIQADRMDYDDSRREVRLIGHVRIQSGDTLMTAPYAQYHTENEVAEFQGGIRLTQPGSTLVGNRMKVWYGQQRAVVNGSVRLVSEKAPGGDTRTPAVLVCQELEYHWATGLGEARGAVKVRQGNRRAFADRARYDRVGETIEISGHVRFEQGQDDWLTSQTALVNLRTETIVAQGQVVGRFLIQQQAPPVQAESEVPPPGVLEPEIPLRPVEVAPPMGLPGLED